MIWPMPSNISDFSALPNSDKSKLAGDNVEQVPNVAGYFSNNYRDYVVRFYQDNFKKLSFFPFAPYRLNYPPEYSFVAIKKHTDTTYLEELVYPMKGSIFVNGFEPFIEGGTPKYWGASTFDVGGNIWETKVTIRLFTSSLFIRIIVWFGTIVSMMLIYNLSRKIFKEN